MDEIYYCFECDTTFELGELVKEYNKEFSPVESDEDVPFCPRCLHDL